MRYFLIALLLIGSAQVMIRILSDMSDRIQARQCVKYSERVQQIKRNVSGVYRIERNKVQYCSEWIYEGM